VDDGVHCTIHHIQPGVWASNRGPIIHLDMKIRQEKGIGLAAPATANADRLRQRTIPFVAAFCIAWYEGCAKRDWFASASEVGNCLRGILHPSRTSGVGPLFGCSVRSSPMFTEAEIKQPASCRHLKASAKVKSNIKEPTPV